jgi:hypothetical protein
MYYNWQQTSRRHCAKLPHEGIVQPAFRDLCQQCSRRHLLEKGPEEVRTCLSQLHGRLAPGRFPVLSGSFLT